MQKNVILPSLGDEKDAVQGAVVSAWLVAEGDSLAEGDDLLEITTDKAAFVVPAPFAGTLASKFVEEDEKVRVGDILCAFEVNTN